jgi:nucleoside-diphosphate-sugar epimerase
MIKKKISITGSTSSVGKLLLKKLAKHNFNLKLSTRRKKLKNEHLNKTYFGDLKNFIFTKKFLTNSDYIVHLAHNENYDENLIIIDNLISVANKSKKIKKFIHCSTSVVVGISSENRETVNENISCNPQNKYQINKFEIEQRLLNGLKKEIDLVILRPTEIANYDNFKSTIYSFKKKFNKGLLNLVYRKILSNRLMNFVSVENVIDSIIFLLKKKKIKNNKNIFNISEDSRFKDLNFYSKILTNKKLKKTTSTNKFIKFIIIKVFIYVLKKPNPYTSYSNKKIKKLGFIFKYNAIKHLEKIKEL